jgi:hypothetical protein
MSRSLRSRCSVAQPSECRRVRCALYDEDAHERSDPVPEHSHTNTLRRIRGSGRWHDRIFLKSSRGAGAPPSGWRVTSSQRLELETSKRKIESNREQQSRFP